MLSNFLLVAGQKVRVKKKSQYNGVIKQGDCGGKKF